MDIDKRILNLLKNSEKSLSAEMISFMLNEPTHKICKRLKALQKHGLIKKVAVLRHSHYELKERIK